MSSSIFKEESVVGKTYEEGMLPYGGRVKSNGEISYAVSEKEFSEKMKRLSSIR